MSRRKQSNPKPLKTINEHDKIVKDGDTQREEETKSIGVLEQQPKRRRSDVSPTNSSSSSVSFTSPPLAKRSLVIDEQQHSASSISYMSSMSPTIDALSRLLPLSHWLSIFAQHNKLEPPPTVVVDEEIDVESDSQSDMSETDDKKIEPPSQKIDELKPKPVVEDQTSFLINGKRYYKLKYICEDCGLRYSDQGTLNAHQQNYCSKRKSAESVPSPAKSPVISKKPTEKPVSDIVKPVDVTEYLDGSNDSAGNVKLMKSIMYQCNHCLFQTDKISIMNRHSRVHLPQKRKQMEELSSSSNADNSQPVDVNDTAGKSVGVSYCKECDIQFSSVKTYLHHRNNYCQKYKTIESVIQVKVKDGSEADSPPTAATDTLSTSSRDMLNRATESKSMYHRVVIKSEESSKTDDDNSNDSESSNQERPLDLSINKNRNDNKRAEKEMVPPDAMKQLNLESLAALNPDPKILSALNLIYLGSNTAPGAAVALNLLINQKSTSSPFLLDNSNTANKKIDGKKQCESCKKTFVDTTQYRGHKCIVSTSEAQSKLVEENGKENPDVADSSCSTTTNGDFSMHYLVKKTLIELYGSERLDTSHSKFKLKGYKQQQNESKDNKKKFFMCTACGYRGNTIRGVKQHGKLHLSFKQHFGIIQAGEEKPMLIYYSKNDCDYYFMYNAGADESDESSKKLEKQSSLEEKECETKSGEIATSSMDNEEEEVDEQRPQSRTYCTKCNIQFRHLNNFLAHKKTYCKDE